MREGWELKLLSDICEIGDGNHSSNYPKKSEMVSNGVPFIRGTNLVNGKISSSNMHKISLDKHRILKKGHLKTGDILFTNRGQVGKKAIVAEVYNDSNLNSQVAWFRCNELVNNSYLYYYLDSPSILKFISENTNGTALQQLTIRQIKRMEILIPPLPEQTQIVNTLDKAFKQIDQAKANLEKNLNNAKELFQSKLNEVFSQRGEGWEEKTLNKICTVKHGFAFKSEYFTMDGEYVLLTPGNFYEIGGYRDRGKKQKYYIGDIPQDYILEKDDLLVAMTEQAAGLLGSPILVPESNKFLHNQRLGLVCPKENISWYNDFFYYLFNTKHVRKELHDSGTGLKVRHTSPTKIGNVKIAYPKSLDKQKEIVSQLNQLNKLSNNLQTHYQQKLNNLEELKKSILQKAFRGELV